MTLEQRLTAAGYTAQELTDLAPMLNNAKFRQTLESQLDEADGYRDQNQKLNKDLDAFTNWFETEITPEHTKALKAAEDAEAARAAAEARLKFMQTRGMHRQGQQQDPDAVAAADAAAAAAAEKVRRDKEQGRQTNQYVSAETFQNAFESTGDAIADAFDLGQDYQELYGSRLNLKQMRLEAKAAKMPVRAYVERKFNFAAKRQEVETAKHTKMLADAEQKGYQKAQMEFGGSNPNMQTLRPSMNPLAARKRVEGDKQPWEINETDRANSRVEKAFKKGIERGDYGATA